MSLKQPIFDQKSQVTLLESVFTITQSMSVKYVGILRVILWDLVTLFWDLYKVCYLWSLPKIVTYGCYIRILPKILTFKRLLPKIVNEDGDLRIYFQDAML